MATGPLQKDFRIGYNAFVAKNTAVPYKQAIKSPNRVPSQFGESNQKTVKILKKGGQSNYRNQRPLHSVISSIKKSDAAGVNNKNTKKPGFRNALTPGL